jgi:hypothetical protein
MTSRTLISVLMALPLLISVTLAPAGTPSAFAQLPSVAPSEIALTLADLPEGFEIDPELTREEPLQNIGLSYTIAAKTDASEEHLSSGPVRVWQQVTRIDRDVLPVELFAEVRDRLMADQNLSPFPGALNNTSNVQLLGQAYVDGEERVVYAIGRVRDNMMWFTLVGGSPTGTSIQSAITLNDLSVLRWERFRSTNGPPALADLLFQTPFPSSELPTGFQAGNIIRQSLSDRALAHNGVAEVDLEMEGPGVENRITYIVYASEVHARASFDDAPRRAAARGSTGAHPDGYGYPVLCVMRSGEVEGRNFGATSCLGLIGNVEVSAFSLLADAEFGSMQDSLELMAAGVKHLEKVTATLSQPR